MLKSLKKLFVPESAKPVIFLDHNTNSRYDLAQGCPDCGEKEFYIGPSGGMCQNVCCGNPLCRSAFNDMGIAGLIHRIPNTTFRSAFPEFPEESEAFLKQQELERLNKETDTFMERL